MRDTKQTELLWLWANKESWRTKLGPLVDRAIESAWKPRELGQEIMKAFYAEIPMVGRRAFWMDVLDQCLEHVDWTEIAKRILIEVGSMT